MSPFQEKISAAVSKKEALFDESLGRYALRSMYAGAYLTMSTAVGIIGADVIEGITANMFVNMAFLGFMLIKEQSAKFFVIISSIFMFVFLINEHLVANFASFMLLAFNATRSHVEAFNMSNILRQWIVVFLGNWLGAGLFIGIAYAWLNQTKTNHIEQ